MAKEFEYTCKTQTEFVHMLIEHKTGFKVNSDADYEIHILYKNGKEFHLNNKKCEGTFARTGIKAGIISTELEAIHFGNISDLEYYVEKFNMVSFWELKADKNNVAAIVFEFITEIIDKTKTSKYYSNDEIVKMLRGFKFNTNASFNLFMTLDLHYITEFSFETLVLFSEYMKKQLGYVDTSFEQEVTSMTTLTSINTEKVTPKFDEKGLADTFLTKTLEEGINLMKNSSAWYIHNIGELAFFHKDFCPFRNEEHLWRVIGNHNFSEEFYKSGQFGYLSIKFDGVHYFKWTFRFYNLKDARKTETSATFSGKQSKQHQHANAELEKANFIKSAKPIDKLNLLTSLYEVKTVFDDSKELTRIFISAHIHSDYAKFSKEFDMVSLLTADYAADSDEKKSVQKLLNNFVKAYRNQQHDLHTALSHSNIYICISVDEKKYIVLKKFHLTIFDIVKIDLINPLHTALEKSLLIDRKDTTSNTSVTEVINEINKKIITPDGKPIIRNIREFKKLLYSCRGKATTTKCTYNKSNVVNFISGYVIAAYNNRLPQYTAILKPKNK